MRLRAQFPVARDTFLYITRVSSKSPPNVLKTKEKAGELSVAHQAGSYFKHPCQELCCECNCCAVVKYMQFSLLCVPCGPTPCKSVICTMFKQVNLVMPIKENLNFYFSVSPSEILSFSIRRCVVTVRVISS